MQEYCRLCHLGLLQLVVSTGKHDVCNTESEDFVGLLEEFLSCLIVVVEVLAHTYKLRSLSGENKCFHNLILFFFVYICVFHPLLHSLQATQQHKCKGTKIYVKT